jgi:hypothetical protein
MARICRIEAERGRVVACRDGCPFWEPGGAVLDGRCAFEHVDVAGRPDIAAELARAKRLLEQAAALDQEHEVRRRFYRLLNEED